MSISQKEAVSPPDAGLVERAIGGDHRAFEALISRYGRRVYTRIARQVHDPDDVDDLAQDVFIAVYTRLPQLAQPQRFSAWINAITDNRIRMWRRRRYVQMRWEMMMRASGNDEAYELDTEEEAYQALRGRLRRAVRRLSEAHRQVVHHYLNGLSYRETAALLGVEVGIVRSRLQEARHRLKKEVLHMDKHTTPTFATLSLFTTRQMGYFATAKEFGKEQPPSGGPEWTFTASIPVRIESEDEVGHFRIGVDFAYLCDAIRTLEAGGPETLSARFIAPDRAMIFAPEAHPGRQALVMPLRIETAEEVGKVVDG